MRPLLVGERNPYGSDPSFALWPEPRGCAGWRLCHRILGLAPDDYLAIFERRNLLRVPTWSVPDAREAAARLDQTWIPVPFILLGRRVAGAFGFASEPPFSRLVARGRRYLLLPHPSGRCVVWNDPEAAPRAARLVFELLRGEP